MRLVADRPERLDKFLARVLPEHSRTKLARLIEEGEVMVDGNVQKPKFPLEPGMEVVLDEPEGTPAHNLAPADIPLEIVFEDDDLLVVNKPRGLAAHPATSLKEPSLVNALLGRNTVLSTAGGDFRPGIVHRLDKETTGLMVVAKNDQAHVSLARQMEAKTAERRYFAVVGGNVEQERFTVSAPIARSKHNRLLMAVDPHGKPAVTHVKRIARMETGTLVACRLETGRTHQIRVHLRAIGLPVLGDTIYAPREYASGPLQLHAGFLAFDHPRTDERVSFYAAPDSEFLGHELVSRAALEEF
ncbi:RluA family pseudouridine synthase [Fimbriimonas ginsengisoli]|uniref:Pseudouridine synthase n=1 Tax=Fimbriimonas ginsengisoli Gsoil 348 TaxID=661478 RepID=A0A068NU93_FIMGI|nr:RluA family pseudouridine synthase [Fimbriimonas ginsengisoli]AIE87068.1 pseudouridine synthase, RluA family [Fimbriimonas ginsengisoli Gsoil 348]